MSVALTQDQLTAVPDGLKSRAQWVLWRYTQVDGKPRKVPYTASGAHASHADPKTWATFDAAVKAMTRYDGIGFVFTADDPYVGIDLDHCYDTQGTLKAWAVDLVRMAQESECYIERTPSGQGLHIIGIGKLPGHGRKVTQIGEDKTGAIEVYDQLRYFTVTGDQTDLGDADGDASTILQWLWKSYGLRDDPEKHIEPGVAVADSEADRVALSLLERASAEFRALWLDMYDVNRHGTDRSAVRFSFLCQLAMKLSTAGVPQTVAMLRAVALRAPFIKSEMSSARGQKWPRLADSECTRAWAWVKDNVQAAPVSTPHTGGKYLKTYGEVLQEAGELRWVVKRLFPAQSVGVMFGASGTFKSFIALAAALHVAHGMRWCGQRTTHGTVVYIAAEGSVGIAKRADAWHRLHGLKPEDADIRFVTVPAAMLTEAEAIRAEIEAAGIRPALVVVDTMSQTFSGEENSANEVAEYMRALRVHLALPFGAAVLVIHHSGHSATERPRGSSAIRANTDFLLGVFREEGQMLSRVEIQHMKDGELIEPLTFVLRSLELGKDRDGDPLTSLVARYASIADDFLKAIHEQDDANFSAFVRSVGYGAPLKEVRYRFDTELHDAKPATRRQAWGRALDKAREQGILLESGDWLELSTGPGA